MKTEVYIKPKKLFFTLSLLGIAGIFMSAPFNGADAVASHLAYLLAGGLIYYSLNIKILQYVKYKDDPQEDA